VVKTQGEKELPLKFRGTEKLGRWAPHTVFEKEGADG